MADTFTLVFEGDIRKFEKNPLKVETEFGVPYAVGVGDAFERYDKLEELIESAIKLMDIGDYERAELKLKEEIR